MKCRYKNGVLALVAMLMLVGLIGITDLQARSVTNWSGLNRSSSSSLTGGQLSRVKQVDRTAERVGNIHGLPLMGGRIVVTALNDDVLLDGECSLPEAILLASGVSPVLDLSGEYPELQAGECTGARPGLNTIILPEGAITLKKPYGGLTGLPPVTSRIVIRGRGISMTVVKRSMDGDTPPFGIFSVLSGGEMTLQNLTIANGDAPNATNYGGGAIFNYQGHVTLENCYLLQNKSAVNGGAVYNNPKGTIDVIESYFVQNIARYGVGGAIYNLGAISISKSSFYGNQIEYYEGLGGAIYAMGGGRVENSTVLENTGGVGGIYIGAPSLETVDPKSVFVLENMTIAGNKGPGLKVHPSALVTIHNTLLAGNAGGDAVGPIKSAGYNIISVCSECAVSPATGDQIGSGSKSMAALLDKATFDKEGNYHAPLLIDSPAVDQGDPSSCPATDQRGVPRPQGLRCDIGAYELPALFPVDTAE